MLMGQDRGCTRMLSFISSSSRSSKGSLPSRSSLFTKTMTGVCRMRQTFMSFSVCSSTPLTQSTTRMTLSTAVSVR